MSNPSNKRKYKTRIQTKRKREQGYDSEEEYETKRIRKMKSRNKSVKRKGNFRHKICRKKKVKKKAMDRHIWKWWEEDSHENDIKWTTLSHKGPLFPPPYKRLPKRIKFYYNRKPMRLNPKAEEVSTFYARMLEEDYVTKRVFNRNFFKDWRKTMSRKERATITDLRLCNFEEMAEYFNEESEKRKQITKKDKQKIKKQNEKLIKEFGYCVVDGHKQKIGNFKIEPPGLFRGRGKHPKMGKLKKRVRPEDVIINIGKRAKIPKPIRGHKWKEVRHDNRVMWLASWTDNIMNSVKYIMLNPSSKLKSKKDFEKYEKSRELKHFIQEIRDDYRRDFRAEKIAKRQLAVALYFIDVLALRAGNEKERGETADTIGCCSLRVEHIRLHNKKNGMKYVVDFDFLGKDSIRYKKSVSVEKMVYTNLKQFVGNKYSDQHLFDEINTTDLNRYLNFLMEGLTSKVFRTFIASETFQQNLNQLTKRGMTVPQKLLAYNRANREVALICNHRRAVPKSYDKQIKNLKKNIKRKRKMIRETEVAHKLAKNSRDSANIHKLNIRLETLEEQLDNLEIQITDKEENKEIALGTSKLNYLDPRITVAWCKKWRVPIEKVYNKTQRDRFQWALEMVGPEYQF